MLAKYFPGAVLMTDTCAQSMVDRQYKHDAMKHLPKESWFRWVCDDPNELSEWNPPLTLLSSKTFLDADRDIRKKMPLIFRLMMAVVPFLVRRMAKAYHINVYRLAGE